MTICLILLTVFLLATTITCLDTRNGTVACIEHERQALLKFKQNVQDDYHMLSSWVGNDCCMWERVKCDVVTGNVKGLLLRGSGDYLDYGYLVGSEATMYYLEGLKHLKYLDLSYSDFQGSRIPKFIGSLKNLSYLNLSNAIFSGSSSRSGNQFDNKNWCVYLSDPRANNLCLPPNAKMPKDPGSYFGDEPMQQIMFFFTDHNELSTLVEYEWVNDSVCLTKGWQKVIQRLNINDSGILFFSKFAELYLTVGFIKDTTKCSEERFYVVFDQLFEEMPLPNLWLAPERFQNMRTKNKSVIRRSSGSREWQVDLINSNGSLFFSGGGWSRLVEDAGVLIGDVLLFTHFEGGGYDFNFEIAVYEPNGFKRF